MTILDDGNPEERTPRRRRALAGAALLACAAAVGGIWWQRHAAAGAGQRYDTAVVGRGSIEELVAATGTIVPRNYVDVGAQVSGQVKALDVGVGKVVQAGDRLAEIDPTVYLANVDARHALLRNQLATRAEREAQLDLALLQLARQQALSREQATSGEALQIAEANARIARAQLGAVRATIEQTQSALRADEANLGYTKIYAPMSGVVVSISARQGQTLNASQQTPVILRIADLSTMTVEAQVSEGDVGKLYKGMDVYFSTLGGSGRWRGKLDKVEPTPTVVNNVVLYKALFDVSNPDSRLLPQMTAQAFFVRDHADDALVVPVAAVAMRETGEPAPRGAGAPPDPAWTALVTDALGARSGAPARRAPVPRTGTVRVVGPDGTVGTRTVTAGIDNRANVEILSGLKAGERVIVGAAGASR
ncbi:efflux RND transporter periplasmic adaptor subunit [Burkholderia ubonensis]|uniref:Hemolysin secretion protein D n=1 Tax=Burkholderia ubonensis TaxID=101571 RepID=A0AAW3MS82_9BURK|nr:efflux RND transporter periplasmic adaptor subunit [Burkholderia ubonensis]KVL13202.1 hypothetical protein WJ45_33300 [Burkholderia ubonensis]KVO42587.1 hypothetical protein WJ75_04525 [Burkholderia ubonensis]KVP94099.1 hypothetical protein WJ96_13155 [Burkholderia ubonensis]KVQ49507.1 hypothetical protein WK04_06880 [Burkholderia ubonensis]KVX25319.1 hypothetical protein WL02_31080 [Burkholderia ubonensis]